MKPRPIASPDEDGDNERRPVTRETRKPFGANVQKLALPPREGYHRHWFNETPGRIDLAKDAGYTRVIDRDGKMIPPRPVGVMEGGGAMMAYAMEIPQEWFDEDMAAQQSEVDKIDQAIRRGEDTSGKPGVDGRYIPSQGIKITAGAR